MYQDTNLFSGAGGWEEGARELGVEPQGIERNPWAVATAMKAGHRVWQTDVDDLDPVDAAGEFPARLLLGSPPCPQFSAAANNHGAENLRELLAAVELMGMGTPVDSVVQAVRERRGIDAALSLEPLRWALALRPRFIALEQVPAVLPLWAAYANRLRGLGYSVATGVLRAEQYGVPQTRRRAILVARDQPATAELGPVQLPAPTHSRYWERNPTRLDGEAAGEAPVQPWVSMHDAIGWGYLNRPSPTLVSQSGGGPRLLDGGARTWAKVAEAIDAGLFVRAPHRQGLPVNRGDLSTCPVDDGAVLQSFPRGYPWQGSLTQQTKQVGNAIPPKLAGAVVGAVLGVR